MNSKRNILDVIERVIKEVPDEFEEKNDFARDLSKLSDSAKYSAPELQSYRWKQFGDLCALYLGKPDTIWKVEIQNIMAGKK